ncbi:NADPH oxidase 5-like [Limulus polyphemus]|uniref:NADPH oxidase 5-like n=1 Tax=Limulus polyphemus TaxID=6850 RepID=A0ABM1BVY8_LIMPO|nr:NADPH oxidase 5-like [Limulus polyphemus]
MRSQSTFDIGTLNKVEEVFRQHVGDNQELQLDQFKEIVQSKNTFFSERMFKLYDTDNSGSVSLEEFLSGIKKFAQQGPEEKLKVVFDIYDIDGDGFLERAELYTVVKACMQENGLSFTNDQIEDLTGTLFEKADVDHSGSISFQEFRTQLERYPGLTENLSISVEKWLLPPLRRSLMNRLKDCLPRMLTWQYIRNNSVSVAFLLVYLAINITLFVTQSVQMMKTEESPGDMLTKLFNQPIPSFDIFMSSEHTLSLHVRAVGEWTNQLWTYFDKQNKFSEDASYYVPNKQYFPDIEEKCAFLTRSPPTYDVTSDRQDGQQKDYIDPGTSVNSDVSREKETHEENSPRNTNKGSNKDDMLQDQIQEGANPLNEDRNNNMLQDQIQEGANPLNEDGNNDKCLQKSGQQCVTPKNRYEEEIKLEIERSSSSDSTRRRARIPHPKKRLLDATLKEGGFRKTLPTVVFPIAWESGEEEEKLGEFPTFSWNKTLDTKHVIEAKKPLKVVLEGPYGLSTRQIFWSQHAVLIGTEIGVTPFASILQSIMIRYQQSRMKCPSCDHQWLNLIPRTSRELRKVDFIWLNQEQRSFEWFISLLSDLEIQQAETESTDDRFLDIHIFITSALHVNDMKALGLQLALDLLHEKSTRCLITGLKTRTQPGQPDWDRMFRELSDQRKGKVTVFYCGPPNLDRILRKKCNEYNFWFRKENF